MTERKTENLTQEMNGACDAVALALVYGQVDDVKQANEHFNAVMADYPQAEHQDLWTKAATRIDEKEIELCDALLKQEPEKTGQQRQAEELGRQQQTSEAIAEVACATDQRTLSDADYYRQMAEREEQLELEQDREHSR